MNKKNKTHPRQSWTFDKYTNSERELAQQTQQLQDLSVKSQAAQRELNRYTSGYLNRVANVLYQRGVHANWITLSGLAIAFLCFLVLSYGLFYLGLIN